ncbi:hypothetical protein [Thalassospira sp.]|uniref:phosphatase domain-containing protein n=1 Tax=Thalassospira sp. TaxID=1912094 RepID=UPI000C3613E3|nr:hypothetical protein [Thalassospira sp.]MBC06231.1 hypothetical protein [Thalassospira sp.]|tara:strand:- start:5657 stop:6196 length:540 start_codon:yes stop_codon:yes gene_type:complete
MPHDSYIRAILPVQTGHAQGIIQMAVPGFDIGPSGALEMDFARCKTAISDLRQHNATHYVCLMTDDEVGADAIMDIAELARQSDIAFHHLPVDDYAKPDAAFLRGWEAFSPQLHASLDQGKSIVLQCLAGYGRSGTIAALLLIERGMAAEIAIKAVQAVNGESIESDEQKRFLLARAAI